MSDADRPKDEEALPWASRVRGRWPGLIWAVPLAALIICIYLAVRGLSHHGIDVTVTFTRAESVTPGDTKVLVQGVEAGHVKHVRVSPDAKHVEVTLTLDPRTRAALNTDTKFWLIGENPTITDLTSVRAAITGVIVNMAPGFGGQPTRRFAGLDQPPVVAPGQKGTFYTLMTRTLGSVQPGTSVIYRGQEIGKVERTALVGLERFRAQVFIYAPYDRFVRDGAEFWTGSPLKLSLTGASLSAGLSSPSSVLQGSIEFDLPPRARGNPQSPPNTTFILYDDQTSAEQGPTGPQVPFELVLDGPAGDLSNQSKISMLGYTVGQVQSARLVFAPGTRRPYTVATILLYPRKLDVAGGPGTDWRGATDRAVNQLLAQGFRAALTQSPPLVGPHGIALVKDRSARPGALTPGTLYPVIPSAVAGGDAQDLLAQADQILAKVNRVPIERIGGNLAAVSANLQKLTGSPELKQSLAHLNSTLAQVDGITKAVNPQVGPLMAKLNQAADEARGAAEGAHALLTGEGAGQDQSLPEAIGQLDQAARSIRALTDYLGRHPEALIRGKAKEK